MKEQSEVRPFTWIVRFDVHPMWVADGGTISDLDALDMLSTRFGSACMNNELAACVLAGPGASRIAHQQGLDSLTEYHVRERAIVAGNLALEAPIAYDQSRHSLLKVLRVLREIAPNDVSAGLNEVIRALTGRDAIGDIFHALKMEEPPKQQPARVTLPAGHRMSCEPERYLSVNEVARLLRDAGVAVDMEEADE